MSFWNRMILLAGGLLLGLPCVSVSDAEAASRPNILLIVSEDNGPELGCYGDPYARTPHFDRLAAEGTLFQRAYVPQAGCSQSRASFLTGLHPHQHGQIGLATWGFRLYDPQTPNVVRSLKEAGYRTGILGKLHINPASAFPFDMNEIGSNFARKDLADYAVKASAFFEAEATPFFLSVNYPDAHSPWIRQIEGLPASPQSAKDVRALPYQGVDSPELRQLNADYYNCMSRLDSLVGDLLAALDRSGKAENTLVVYIGDHGADFLRGKRTNYEGGVRIPMIVRWPPGGAPGQIRSELVSTIDLLPTMLAAAGIEPLADRDGRSLLPLLRGESPDWREYLFTEYHTHAATANYYPQRAVRNDRYKLIENLLPGEVNPGYAFTNGRIENIDAAIAAAPTRVREAYRLMETPPRWELYDLDADPYEFENLADSPQSASVLRELQEELQGWRERTNDPLLDQANVLRLQREVNTVNKETSRKYDWQYPSYFFEGTAAK